MLEAPKPSGSLITAQQALEQGREVFAVPGPRGSQRHSGCFELINQGAKLVCSAEDVLRELHPLLHNQEPQTEAAHKNCPADTGPTEQSAQTPPPEDLSPDARSLYSLLQHSGQSMHVDSICRELGWDAGKTSSVLLLLELRGLVLQQPGMQYVCRT